MEVGETVQGHLNGISTILLNKAGVTPAGDVGVI